MALVLSRGPLEQIRIVPPGGCEILVTLVEVDARGRCSRARLAVEAPVDVVIQRPECDRWSLTNAAQAEAEIKYRQRLIPQRQEERP
jgi:sRNA-binding carbon storage regulator CsrA